MINLIVNHLLSWNWLMKSSQFEAYGPRANARVGKVANFAKNIENKLADFGKSAEVYKNVSNVRWINMPLPNPRCYNWKTFCKSASGKSIPCQPRVLLDSLEKNSCTIVDRMVRTYKEAGAKYDDLQIMKPSDKNTYSATYGRQFSTYLMPEKTVLKKFINWAQKDMTEKFKKHSYGSFRQTWEEFLLDSDPKKRRIYANAMKELNEGAKVDTKINFFMKRDEKAVGATRPRNIGSLDTKYTVLTAPVVRILMKILKELYPVISGMNFDESADRIEKEFKDLKATETIDIATDGSSWDSHQDMETRIGIDNFFIDKFFNEAYSCSGLPERFRRESKKLLKQVDFGFIARYPNSRAIMTKGKVRGTTISGHAAATTLGNSLRQYYAHEMSLLDCEKGLCVSGDDTIIRLALKDFETFYKQYWTLHSPASNIERGIGLCSTGLIINPRKTPFRMIGFLSKDYLGIPKHARIARPLHKFVTADFINAKKLKKNFNRKDAASAVTLGNMYFLNDPSLKDYQIDRIMKGGMGKIEDIPKVLDYYQIKTQNSTRAHNDFQGLIDATMQIEKRYQSNILGSISWSIAGKKSTEYYDSKFKSHPFVIGLSMESQLKEVLEWINLNR